MRVYWALALLVVAGCTTQGNTPEPAEALATDPLTACVEPRPQICTREYLPVCARLAAGGYRTYASACSACADPLVAGFQQGSCVE